MSAPTPALEAVLEIVALMGDSADPDAVIGESLTTLADALGARAVALFVGDPEFGGAHLHAARGPAAPTGDHILQGSIAASTPAQLAALGLPGGILVPARVGGRTAGALGVVPADGRPPSATDLRAIRAVAQVIGLAARAAQLTVGLADRVRELDRQSRQLDALTQVARRLSAAPDEGEAHARIAALARSLVAADGALLLLGEPGGGLREVAAAGAWEGPQPRPEELLRALGGEAPQGPGTRAAVGIPLIEGGRAVGAAGVIAVVRAGTEDFDGDDLKRLRGLADQAGTALSSARLLADLRRGREERRSLAAAIVMAQEDERRRVAEDLHDGPVQDLVGIGLMLDALVGDLSGTAPEAAGDIGRAAAAARETVRGLRRAMADLHPLSLEEQGFGPAVRSLVERLEWRGVEVRLDLGAVDRLGRMQRTVAFRIVQEAVANVARHAEAGHVAITATGDEGGVDLEVRDDGRGFDAARERPGAAAGHLGLAAVEERVALVGGVFALESAPGRGTVLRVRLPLGEGDGAQPGPESRSSAAASAASSANRSSTTT